MNRLFVACLLAVNVLFVSSESLQLVSTSCIYASRCFDVNRVDETTGCNRTCTFVNHGNKRQAAQSPLVMGMPASLRRTFPGQILVPYFSESQIHTAGLLAKRSPEQAFNFTAGFDPLPPAPRPWFARERFFRVVYDMLAAGTLPPPIAWEVKTAPDQPLASTVISNGGMTTNKRCALVAALGKKMRIANYGGWGRNAQALPESKLPGFQIVKTIPRMGGARPYEKARAMAPHLFHLAFENSDCPWYHTEKSFQALAVGTVPVYLGARTYRHVVPPHSVIYAKDFPSGAALADYLLEVSRNETLYNSYLSWRARPMPVNLRALQYLETPEWVRERHCILCRAAHGDLPPRTYTPSKCESPMAI